MKTSSLRPKMLGRSVVATGSTGSTYEGILVVTETPVKPWTNSAGVSCKTTKYAVQRTTGRRSMILTTDSVVLPK